MDDYTPKHTPGPWVARGMTVWTEAPDESVETRIVANCNSAAGADTNCANARLIAQAPEAVGALRALFHVMRRVEDVLAEHDLAQEELPGIMSAAGRVLRAVHARAKQSD